MPDKSPQLKPPPVIRTPVDQDLPSSIKQAVDQLGGFKHFIKKGDVVFLKPNFNTADPYPASTDLNFLKAVTQLVYRAGAKLVMIGDSSTVTLNTRKVFDQLGVFDLQELPQPPRIYIFEEGKWTKTPVPQGKYLKSVHLPAIIRRADKLIWLPCLKTHKYAQLTGALKLAIGLVKPFERMNFHLRHLQEKIAELNTLFHPDLVIMDARQIFINQGPSFGDVRQPNLILASTGRVAIDIVGVKIIQSFPGNSLKDIQPEDLPQIKRALELGIQ
jgi:uncharacterized protein (DUF362 family)